MNGMQFDIEGEGGIEKAMEKAAKQFPYSAEKVLKKEGYYIAKDLGKRVQHEAKGHHYKDANSDGEHEPLAESFSRGKVVKQGSSYTVAAMSKAPHYHLYELGHDLCSHNRKNKKGKGKPGSGKKIGEVAGRKTVARYMAQRAEYSDWIGQELLNEILKDAGFE